MDQSTQQLIDKFKHNPAMAQALLQSLDGQRLMQMLGAYANIGHNKGKTWYLEQIPAGLAHLRRLLPGSMLAEPLAGMLE